MICLLVFAGITLAAMNEVKLKSLFMEFFSYFISLMIKSKVGYKL